MDITREFPLEEEYLENSEDVFPDEMPYDEADEPYRGEDDAPEADDEDDALYWEDDAHDQWSGHDRTISPRQVQMDCRRVEWFEELNQLGKHWRTDLPKDDPLRKMQVGQALSLAYAALWANGTKDFMYRKDMDDVIGKAMEYLKSDINNYDPEKSPLGSMVSSKIEGRIKDAKRNLRHVRDHQEWFSQLEFFHNSWPDDPSVRSALIEKLITDTFRFYQKRIDSRLKTAELRNAAEARLRGRLLAFEPQEQTLGALIRLWVDEELGGDRQDITVVSADVPMGEDGENTMGEMLPAPGANPIQQLMDSEEYSVILMAMVASYQIALGDKNLKARTRYCRLNYTEQLSCFGQQLNLPQTHSQDLLKPLDPDYFRYFMYTGNAKEITLRTIAKAKLLPVVGEGPYLLVNTKWDDHGFLPAKAQIGYLKSRGISSSDSTVSGHRTRYETGFLADLRSRL